VVSQLAESSFWIMHLARRSQFLETLYLAAAPLVFVISMALFGQTAFKLLSQYERKVQPMRPEATFILHKRTPVLRDHGKLYQVLGVTVGSPTEMKQVVVRNVLTGETKNFRPGVKIFGGPTVLGVGRKVLIVRTDSGRDVTVQLEEPSRFQQAFALSLKKFYYRGR
jgi:hypothetical protein